MSLLELINDMTPYYTILYPATLVECYMLQIVNKAFVVGKAFFQMNEYRNEEHRIENGKQPFIHCTSWREMRHRYRIAQRMRTI